MLNWQKVLQSVQQFVNFFIRTVKARRREEAAIGIAAVFFFIGYSFMRWLPEGLQEFVKSWRGHQIISGILYIAAAVFLARGIYFIWKLVQAPALPPSTNRPSAIKGPLAFTEADGELFRRLGREEDLKKLLGYITDNQVGLIVLMGASGAGKTSLLRAGLTDILKDSGIRLHYWEAVPTDSGRALLQTLQESWQDDVRGKVDDTAHQTRKIPLRELDDLINPTPELAAGRHVVVLDQFEQLRGATTGKIFKLLKKLARTAKPPHEITWIVAFRRQFRADWADFMIGEQELGFFPREISLRLFTSEQARNVTSQLIETAGLRVEQKVIDNLIEAATVDGEVSSVDIGIGLLILSELSARQGDTNVTDEFYHFAGGAEGLLTQYVDRCLAIFPDEDRETLLSAMLALQDSRTDQRIAEGKTSSELSEETKTDPRRLSIQLNRLTQRDIRLLEAVTKPDGEIRYRLPHERFIPALNRAAGKLLGELETAKSKFVNAFSAWKKHKGAQYLLRGKDLRLVEQHEHQIPWGRDENEKLEFLKSSRFRRNMKRALALGLIIALLVSSWIAISQYRRYDSKRELLNSSYPAELYDYQNQLTALELKEPINPSNLSWLKSKSLEEFTILTTNNTDSIDPLVESLATCSALKKLTLTASSSQVRNFEALSKLTNLTQLALYVDYSEINNLDFLSKLPKLTELSLDVSGTQVSNIDVLSKLPNLTQLTLDISDSKVRDTKALGKLRNLSQLHLDISDTQDSNSQSGDIDFLTELPNLTQLRLSAWGSNLSNIDALGYLTNLTKLNLAISGNQPNNFKVLGGLTKLTDLTLYLIGQGNDIEIISKLPKLTHLELNLSDGQTSNLEVLSNLPAITHLELILARSQVGNIEILSKLPNLTQLTLAAPESQMSNIEILGKLSNLTQLTLFMGGSQVSNIGFLSKLTNLTQLTLDISRSPVTNVEILSKLTHLTQLGLDISDCPVDNIEALSKLTNLTQLHLNLGASRVSNVDALGMLPHLAQLALDVNHSRVSNIEVLSDLYNIEELTLKAYRSNVRNLGRLNCSKCGTLDLDLTAEQRLSLKSIPPSVSRLKF